MLFEPPTLALPLKGGGKNIAQNKFPSPSKGEGWGGGEPLDGGTRSAETER